MSLILYAGFFICTYNTYIRYMFKYMFERLAMPQLYLYVPEEVASQVRQRAEASNMTVSHYLAELIRREVGTGWPKGFFEDVIGGWKGEPLQRSPQGDFEPRDEL